MYLILRSAGGNAMGASRRTLCRSAAEKL